MAALLIDLRYTLRKLFSRPGFLFTTVLSLALGVGVNATFFSAANTALIEPMKVPQPGEMVRVYSGHHSPFTPAQYRWFKEHTQTVSALFAETNRVASLNMDKPVRVQVGILTGNTFAAMEAVPYLGRLFIRTDDERPAAEPEAVLSFGFWNARLGSDSSIVGQTLRINNGTFRIVGVSAQGFHSTQQGWGADLFIPMGDFFALSGRQSETLSGSLYVTGRLASGKTVDDADAELKVLGQQLAQSDKVRYKSGEFIVNVKPARGITEEARLGATMASAFLMVLAALILVIAATNAGNVLLARNAARRLELGVRVALGASRRRLMRLLLLEGVVIAGLSGLSAMALAWWVTGLIPRVLPEDVPVFFDFTPDWRVVAFTGVVSLGALALFGLVPALQATRVDVVEGIKQDSGTGTRALARLRRRFLMVQIALCTVLLVTASLFARSLGRAGTIDPGFNADGMLIAPYIDIENLGEDEGKIFFARLLEEASQIPGVQSVSLSRTPELTGSNAETQVFREGESLDSEGRGGTSTYFNIVGPNYHANLGVPLVKGRDFAATDIEGAPLVAIVNETFAAQQWPGEDPIGKRLSWSGEDKVAEDGTRSRDYAEVIGVSKNVKYHTLGEGPKTFVTVPQAQQYVSTSSLELRLASGASERAVSEQISAVLSKLEPGLAPPRVQRLTEMQGIVLLPAKLAAGMLGAIGGLAVLLAAVGITGVASFSVTQRRREIGVRMALGAQPLALLRAVLGETWKTVAIGAVGGLLVALGVGKVVSSMLYGLPFADPVTFAVVPLLLVAMAVVSAAGPARRAVGVQPVEALRE